MSSTCFFFRQQIHINLSNHILHACAIIVFICAHTDLYDNVVIHSYIRRLCTVVKDPKNRYIDEWVDYHFALGFSRIRIYDNTENFTLEDWGRHKSYSSQVDRIHYLPGITHDVSTHAKCGNKFHSPALMECAQFAKLENISWVSGLDVDEFLVIREPSLSVVDFMEQYCKYPCGQLSLNWLLFGPSGRREYKPVPVTKRFTHRLLEKRFSLLVKGIADPNAIDFVDGFWMHTWIIDNTRTWLDTSGTRQKADKRQKWWLWMMMNAAQPTDAGAIHHYKTLSEGEWHEKNCARGHWADVDVSRDCERNASALFEDSDTVIDETVWERLKLLVPEYSIFDNLTKAELG